MAQMGFARGIKKDALNKSVIIDEDFTHASIIGSTGSGKTSSIILPNIDDRVQKGHGILVYDYKGNLSQKIKYIAEKNGRLEDVVTIGSPWDKKINIIKSLSDPEIDALISKLISKGKHQDLFWENSTKELIIPLLKLFRMIDRLKKDDSEFTSRINFEIDNMKYDKEPSLKSIYESFASIDKLKDFITNYEKITVIIASEYAKYLNENSSKANLIAKNIFELITHLKKIKEQQTKYTEYEPNNVTFLSIYSVFTASLSSIGKVDALNINEIDIVEELYNQKIVIVDVRMVPDRALSILTYSMFEQFKMRFMLSDKTPITLFFDEAQKILNDNMKIPLDTMREAKVEIVMAYQHPSLIIEKIGEENYRALNTNLNKKFFLKNNADVDGVDRELNLEVFEYVTNADNYKNIYKADPIFVDEKDEFEVEYKFQQINEFDKKVILKQKIDKKYIIIYEPRLYHDAKVILKDEDLKSRPVEIKNNIDMKICYDILSEYTVIENKKSFENNHLDIKEKKDYDEDQIKFEKLLENARQDFRELEINNHTPLENEMMYIPIDSTIDVKPHTKAIAEFVLEYADDKKQKSDADSFYMCSRKVPIFFVDEDKFKTYSDVKYTKDKNDREKPPIEWLGIYTRIKDSIFDNKASIFICPQRIQRCTNSDLEFDYLFTLVVLHELAHAKMDVNQENIKYGRKDKFFTYMEESMANKLALDSFDRYCKHCDITNIELGQEVFTFSKEFIKKQPPAYVLGLRLFEDELGDWKLWSANKPSIQNQFKDAWLASLDSDVESIKYAYDCLFFGQKQAFINKIKSKYQKNSLKEVFYFLRKKGFDKNITLQEKVELKKEVANLIKNVKDEMLEFAKEVKES